MKDNSKKITEDNSKKITWEKLSPDEKIKKKSFLYFGNSERRDEFRF